MNIRDLILLSIGPSMLTSCDPMWGCNPGSDMVDINTDLLAEDVTVVMERYDLEDVADLSCDSLCETLMLKETDWEYSFVDTCSMTLDSSFFEPSEDTAEMENTDIDGSTVVGSIECSGEIIEYMCKGRRPLGYQEGTGGYFARSAHLEAASVVAFVQLSRQLQRWDAPKDLIERCVEAAQDEVRHSNIMARLAKCFTEKLSPLQVDSTAEDLFTVALHNATEGCIFETWSALEMKLISHTAKTEELRNVFAKIAEDETKHAQLSWDLHHWFLARLSAPQRQEILTAQRNALRVLQEEVIPETLAITPKILGLNKVDNLEEISSRFIQQISA